MIVKHKEIISVIGYYFMLFCVLFLRWYNNTNLLIYISTFLCIILFIFNIKEILWIIYAIYNCANTD